MKYVSIYRVNAHLFFYKNVDNLAQRVQRVQRVFMVISFVNSFELYQL